LKPQGISSYPRALFALLSAPGVNALARAALRPVAGGLPRRWLHRVPFVGTLELTLPDARVLRFTSDGREHLSAVLYWEGWQGFEPETQAVVAKLLPHCRVVLDVGAYMGYYALLAAVGHPERRVYAFEPVPASFARLTANLGANGLANVRAVHAAVGETEGEVPLYVPGGVWLPSHSSTRAGFRAAERVQMVPAVRLDAFVEREGVGPVDLIKIDTEGTEDEVLRGGRALVERDRPWIVCEVLRGLTEDRLHAALRGLDYGFFLLTPEGPQARAEIRGDETHVNRNFLFAPRERLEALGGAAALAPGTTRGR
jgi:FkbM family methyltransferase